MVLDSVVQGLPLQTTAGELVKDFTTFLLSLPVMFNYHFSYKNRDIYIGTTACDLLFMLLNMWSILYEK